VLQPFSQNVKPSLKGDDSTLFRCAVFAVNKKQLGTQPPLHHIDIKKYTGGSMMSGRDRPINDWIKWSLEEGLIDELDARAVYLFPTVIKAVGGSKWGYIDAKGESNLSPIYDQAGDFQDNDLAIVRMIDRDGVIDSSGYFVVKPKYDTINPFTDGRATVINRAGFKVIDESGKEITAKAYSFIDDFKEGRALAADTNEKGQYLYGYLNRYGKEVIPLEYESAAEFNEGKAVVKLQDGTYALIGLTGKIIKKYPYAFVGDYGGGLLSFKQTQDGKYGFINEEGTIIIKPKFSGVEPFKNKRAIVNIAEDYRNQYGLINGSGQYMIKPNYNEIRALGENRFALGKADDPEKPYLGSTYAVADGDGHILTGFIYNQIAEYVDGFASANNDHSTFFIDRSGKRNPSLPMVSGTGALTFDKTLIKGEIDYRLLYLTREGEVVWQQNQVIPLSSGKIMIEQKFKPNKDYLVYFPQIKGMAETNLMLKDLAGVKNIPSDTQLESNYMGDFNVPFNHKNLVVIEITGYNYPFGAAHGMPVQKYAHINLQTGENYHLKDLFKKNSPYIKVISEIIADQIKSNDKYSYVFPDSYKGIKSDQPFYINEDGLNIYFEPYEIAPYAAGFPTFTIPFEEVTELINQNGPFWKSFH
jgi:hypothetical protein